MSLTKNAELVVNAQRKRRTRLIEALAADQNVSFEDASGYLRTYGPWAHELNHVNLHITVPQEEIEAAAEAYSSVAKHLVKELHWPVEVIKVIPQGSASTQTLIRSPDNSKFDIDAVCQVEISRVDAEDPVGFFDTIGTALQDLDATPKKRCWNIPCANEPFYLEFTPSVPLATASIAVMARMAPRFTAADSYLDTALAVVDNPTRQWKTSNPAGFASWVNETAKLQLIRQIAMESASFNERQASIDPVPSQDVEITDTLRVAIRLFKRHRDMCVRREQIEKEFKPISVIIVTLLTACYSGLADLQRTYNHPLELLVDLADLLPEMVAFRDGEYHVDNPTVLGENFAERWNHDDGERLHAFRTWCDILIADMRTILATKDESEIRRQVQRIFGCGPSNSSPGGIGGPGVTSATRNPPPRVTRTEGLA